MLCLPAGSVKQTGTVGSSMDHWVVVALGSNLGDRQQWLGRAREALRAGGWHWTRASGIYESPAVGGPPGQGPYLNQVLATPLAECALGPRELLDLGLAIEARCGRHRRRRWEARVLDIDLLLHGGRQMDEAGLVLPHPRMRERRFVLVPLAEILPSLELPGAGATVAEILARLPPCPAGETPRRIGPPAGGVRNPGRAATGDPGEERMG